MRVRMVGVCDGGGGVGMNLCSGRVGMLCNCMPVCCFGVAYCR